MIYVFKISFFRVFMINRWANTDAEWTAQRKTGISQKDCYWFWRGGRSAGWRKCCFKSLNSLSRSRYQTCSIRFKVGVVRLSHAQTVITGGYAFYVFFEKIYIGISKIELSFLSTFENHQKIIPLRFYALYVAYVVDGAVGSRRRRSHQVWLKKIGLHQLYQRYKIHTLTVLLLKVKPLVPTTASVDHLWKRSCYACSMPCMHALWPYMLVLGIGCERN